MDKVKYVGYFFIVWGIADIVLGYMGTDVWHELFGVQLEGFLYSYSGAILIVIGFLLTRARATGTKDSDKN